MNTNSLILTLLSLKNWGPKKVYDFVCKYEFKYDSCVAGLASSLTEEEKYMFKIELQKSKNKIQNNFNKGIKTISILDNNFPKKLYMSNEKCVFLYYIGNIDLLKEKAITIIGTRKPTEDFIKKGQIVSKCFAEAGYVIVSGLALGCDTIAHEASVLNGGKTIAVLPSPCDNIYPKTNEKLAKSIVETGGLLISEYGTGEEVSKFNYPKRDTIQSLLSNVVLIIQAEDKSGTMIATKKSLKDKKLVYAIEGNNLTLVKNYVDVYSKDDLKEIETWII